jgi:hypothetical protein
MRVGPLKSVAMLAGVVLIGACGAPAEGDPDSGLLEDAGPVQLDDAGGGDAGSDAGFDGGPECDCGRDVSECCDGCFATNEGGSCTTPIPGTGGAATCAAGACVGETCECSTGPCCDGCFFRPTTYQCATDILYESRCVTIGATACPGYSDRISESFGNVFCSGASAECDGPLEHVQTVSRSCWSAADPVFCVEDSAPPIAAHCAHLCT